MTEYILEGFNIEANRTSKKLVFYDKDKNPILEIKKMKDILLIGNLMIEFFADVYLNGGLD